MQIVGLIFDRPLQLLQRRFNRAALSVAQHDHQARTELLGGKFDATDQGRRHDVSGAADDEQIPQPLIEDDFYGYPRIGTAENGGEWLLARRQFETARPTADGSAIADVRHEAPVSLLQERERFSSQDHR